MARSFGSWDSATSTMVAAMPCNPLRAHRRVFDETKAKCIEGFTGMHAALYQLERDTLAKLDDYCETQQDILQACPPGRDAYASFEETSKKVERAVEAFASHASNLSHVKLSLARVAALVSPEGNLAQLVKTQPSSSCSASSSSMCKSEQVWSDFPAAFPPASSLATTTTAMTSIAPQFPTTILKSELGKSAWSDFLATALPSAASSLLGMTTTAVAPLTQTMADYYEFDSRSSSSSYHSPPFAAGEENNPPLGPAAALSVPPLLRAPRTNNNTCFVFYLPPSMTSETLRALFMQCGTVLNAYVAMDKKTNRPRGFGFVDFASASEAQAAVSRLDKLPIEGKFLSVTIKV